MNSSNTSVYPLLYAAPISYYALWLKQNGCMDGFENFQKQSFRNRARIFGANGVISLSIPVQTHSKKVLSKDVEISNIENWQRIHWRTLESAYKSSPFFEFYAHLWHPLYQKQYILLWEFNLAVHEVVLQCMQLKIDTCYTSSFLPIQTNDYRKVFTSKKAHPVSVNFPVYQQVFSYDEPFEKDLSILDAIFNLGPETEGYLRKLEVG